MAKISDNDAIYELLDKLDGEGQHEKVLEKIAEVPADDISNKLWFKKIRALNGLGRFDEAKREISLLSKRCEDPSESALLYYYLGYTFVQNGSTLKGVECYYHTKELDPDFENIQATIDGAMESVEKDLASAKTSFENLFADIKNTFDSVKDKRELTFPEAANYISYIQASFITSGMGIRLPFDKPFFECDSDEDKQKLKMFLEGKFGITDLKSLQQWFGYERIAPMIDGVDNAMKNNDPMPVDRMSINERVHFESIQLVLRYLGGLLPEAGVSAWDYNYVIALARIAYAAGVLTKTEFAETTIFFTDETTNYFSSWEEFARSVIIGGFFNGMFETQYDVKYATQFGAVACNIFKNNYAQVDWIK